MFHYVEFDDSPDWYRVLSIHLWDEYEKIEADDRPYMKPWGCEKG